jgi:hypothetical protein
VLPVAVLPLVPVARDVAGSLDADVFPGGDVRGVVALGWGGAVEY